MFKICPMCKHEWGAREEFLGDTTLQLIGYQINFKHLEAGLFLFNHSCQTTLAVPAGEFADMYDGPIFVEHKKGTASCPNYCLNASDLQPCPVSCECAYVREILSTISKKEIPVPVPIPPTKEFPPSV